MRPASAAVLAALSCTLPVSLASCSDPVQPVVSSGADTLRAETERMAAAFEWTGELEPGRLTAEAPTRVSPRVRQTTLAVLASLPEEGAEPPSVGPFVDGFAPLDLSLMPPALAKRVDSFCAALSAGKDADSFMASGCLYSLALFCRDSGGRLPRGKGWLVGSPSVVGTGWEVPVRFGPSFDVLTYWTEQGGSWRVDQVFERSVGGGG